MYRIAVCKLHPQPQAMLEKDIYEHVEKGHPNALVNKDYNAMKEWWAANFEFYSATMKPGDAAWIKIQHSKIETGVGK